MERNRLGNVRRRDPPVVFGKPPVLGKQPVPTFDIQRLAALSFSQRGNLSVVPSHPPMFFWDAF